MKKEYKTWIGAIAVEESMGNCKHYSNEMVREFPELRVAKGFVILSNNKKYQHMWCIGGDGEVVDPTKKQYYGYHVIGYEELIDSDAIPVGKCMNCDDWIMSDRVDSTPFCSEQCWNEYNQYLGDMG